MKKVDAVYVENGTIVDVGSKEELENQYAAVTLYDLKGKTMIPGLVDSHMHLIGHGEITPSRFIKLYILWRSAYSCSEASGRSSKGLLDYWRRME